jgi:ABC-type sugar transport system ATPase subunit
MLKLTGIEKKYQDFQLKNISFTVEEGDYFLLLGESGAGKSLILEIIAGLIKPSKGSIFFKGRDLNKIRIQKRNIAMLFQDYAVFPHLRVSQNIAYALKGKESKSLIEKKTKLISSKLGISHLLHRKPGTLSGGELQRVALARVLIMEPELLLLDEPLSSLDIHLQDELKALLKKLNREGLSIIHVSHNYTEVMALASRIAVLSQGEIIQTGKPVEVFRNPQSRFVARFSGIQNFYRARYLSENMVILDEKAKVNVLSALPDKEGYAFFRAEDVILSLHKLDSSLTNQFKGVIREVLIKNDAAEISVDTGIIVKASVSLTSLERLKLCEEMEVWISFKASALSFVY